MRSKILLMLVSQSLSTASSTNSLPDKLLCLDNGSRSLSYTLKTSWRAFQHPAAQAALLAHCIRSLGVSRRHQCFLKLPGNPKEWPTVRITGRFKAIQLPPLTLPFYFFLPCLPFLPTLISTLLSSPSHLPLSGRSHLFC